MKRVLAAAATGLLLGGCVPTFEVEVFNDTNVDVSVAIEQRVFLGEDSRLASGSVRPGETRSFGPVSARPIDAVQLHARPTRSSFAIDNTIRIEPGYTYAFIEEGYAEELAIRTERRRPRDGTPPGEDDGQN
ncbi:MAG: hypothetical protein AAGI17_06005 [Planctomycetota bacterium]